MIIRNHFPIFLLPFQQKHQKKDRFLIGCFSAASNVTGIISDTHQVAALLHKYGALSFWDYATAGKNKFQNFNELKLMIRANV